MSTYRRHRMLRSLYLDALHAESYPFSPNKTQLNTKGSASERTFKHCCGGAIVPEPDPPSSLR